MTTPARITAADDRYGNTKLTTIRAAVQALREAIRAEGTPAIQDAWDRIEPWVDRVFTGDSKP